MNNWKLSWSSPPRGQEMWSVFDHIPQEVDSELEIFMQEIYQGKSLRSAPAKEWGKQDQAKEKLNYDAVTRPQLVPQWAVELGWYQELYFLETKLSGCCTAMWNNVEHVNVAWPQKGRVTLGGTVLFGWRHFLERDLDEGCQPLTSQWLEENLADSPQQQVQPPRGGAI